MHTLWTRMRRCSWSQFARCKGVREDRGTAKAAELWRLSIAKMIVYAAKVTMNGAPSLKCGRFGNRFAYARTRKLGKATGLIGNVRSLCSQ